MNIRKILSGKGVDTQEITESVTVDTDVSVKETDQMAGTDTQVTQEDLNATMANAIASLAVAQEAQVSEMANLSKDVRALLAQEGARKIAVLEDIADVSVQGTDVVITSVHERASDTGAREFKRDEVVFGITRQPVTVQGVTFPIGSQVTAYPDKAGKPYKAVWNSETTRLLGKGFWESKGNVRRTSTPAKAVKNEQTASARQAQADAVNRYNGETVMFAKGTKIRRTKNGRAQVPTESGRSGPFVAENIVTSDGRLSEDVTMEYFEDGLTGKVTRHMKGSCTCAIAWPCPAVQILGPNDALVGQHLYTLAGGKDAPFLAENIASVSLTTRSTSKFLAKHLDVWGLDS